MALPVIPVLTTGQDQLTKPADQIAYILRHAYYNPGGTSSYIEYYLISLQKLFAECNNNLGEMIPRFVERLQYAINLLYPDKYSTTTNVKDIDDFTREVEIGIIDRNTRELVLKSDDIRIKNEKFYIKSTAGEAE